MVHELRIHTTHAVVRGEMIESFREEEKPRSSKQSFTDETTRVASSALTLIARVLMQNLIF